MKKKAFSFIEVLIAILLLSVLALFLLPSLRSNLDDSWKIKDMADTSFILQEAIEISRENPIGTYVEDINGKKIDISIKKYEFPGSNIAYKKIRASFKEKSFELIEACDEKGL